MIENVAQRAGHDDPARRRPGQGARRRHLARGDPARRRLKTWQGRRPALKHRPRSADPLARQVSAVCGAPMREGSAGGDVRIPAGAERAREASRAVPVPTAETESPADRAGPTPTSPSAAPSSAVGAAVDGSTAPARRLGLEPAAGAGAAGRAAGPRAVRPRAAGTGVRAVSLRRRRWPGRAPRRRRPRLRRRSRPPPAAAPPLPAGDAVRRPTSCRSTERDLGRSSPSRRPRSRPTSRGIDRGRRRRATTSTSTTCSMHVLDTGASDLHLTSGARPTIRLNGELEQLEDYPILTPPVIQRVLYAALTQKQREKFEENLELDFAYSVPGPGPVPRQHLPPARRARRGLPHHPVRDQEARGPRRPAVGRELRARCRAASSSSPARPAPASRRRWRR